MTIAAVEFTPWVFLTIPLKELCDLFDARLFEMPGMSDDFKAAVYRLDGELFVILPKGRLNMLECETAARAALARWFDVDVTDWPIGFNFYDSHDGITWEQHDMRQGGEAK